MFKRLILVAISLSILGVAAISAQSSTVMAKTKAAKVLKTTNIKNVKVHVTSGLLYTNKKLTKVAYHAGNYDKRTFTRTSQITVKKANGKKAVYQYIKSGKVKGWIWRGDVLIGAYQGRKLYWKESIFKSTLISIVNKARSKHHLKPLTYSTKIEKIAKYRADQQDNPNWAIDHMDKNLTKAFKKLNMTDENWENYNELYIQGAEIANSDQGVKQEAQMFYDDEKDEFLDSTISAWGIGSLGIVNYPRTSASETVELYSTPSARAAAAAE
ncbi:hypothetical protein FD04_GL002004 [Secundilactobacillus odoratitofui DSM 19909 = JCM 15043]|uniref:SCP domain-containing protein n=1 Tax=Secundilactobacillus odoratitofui DSM 19909 = JCM 15043 TaxID=1423776 RepID=A0A0R1LNR5_9LACO|nr:CAP domain-containing protein [Secundilactobacillus odoratitofui]KRK97144.1 hypothetical protein FD04_GL002004 [Secundilactobacillus odoratitofui DSM 19909 = JCM 15043]